MFLYHQTLRYPSDEERNIARLAPTKMWGGFCVYAAASLSSVVLTLDIKPGPLRTALGHGGKVLDMTPFETSGLSLAGYITAYHEAA